MSGADRSAQTATACAQCDRSLVAAVGGEADALTLWAAAGVSPTAHPASNAGLVADETRAHSAGMVTPNWPAAPHS